MSKTELNAEQIQAALTRAENAFRTGEVAESEQVLDELRASLPTNMKMGLDFAVALQRKHWSEAFAAAEVFAGTKAQSGPQPKAWNTLGANLVASGEYRLAEQAFAKRIAIAPEDASGHYNRAFALLALGEYKEGWQEYECRYGLDQAQRAPVKDTAGMWDGQPLPRGTLFVDSEQGFGDVMQFSRFLPLAAERCEWLIVRCPKPVAPLIRSMGLAHQIVDRHAPFDSISFDAYCPIGRLAHLFSPTIQDIPDEVPYLHVSAPVQAQWAERVATLRRKTRGNRLVGMVWSANSKSATARQRSVPPEELLPLLKLPGITFVSLQVGDDAPELTAAGLRDFSGELQDFEHTGALIRELDDVVTVDTSVAHVVTGLGQPGIVMLARHPDWRFANEQARAKWFPTLECVHQTEQGKWREAVAQTQQRLAQRLSL